MYCEYGVGLPTERAYIYTRDESSAATEAQQARFERSQEKSKKDSNGNKNKKKKRQRELSTVHHSEFGNIDVDVHTSDSSIRYGVLDGEGDGTVPLLSLGYPCVKLWKGTTAHNPGGVRVVTREVHHNPSTNKVRDLRGGPATAEHVDIMGNHQVIDDLLKIAADQAGDIQDRVVSDIETYANRIHL